MISPRSLSFRLLAGALVWITVALGVAGAMFSTMFRGHVEAQHAARLEALLGQLAGAIEVGADGQVTLLRELADGRFRKPYSGLYWQVADSGGAPVLRSRSLWDAALPLPPDTVAGGAHLHVLQGPDGQRVRVLERAVTLPDSERWLRLAVGENLAVMQRSLEAFDRVLALSLGTLGAGLAVAAAVQVFGGLMPLRRLRRALARVRHGRAGRLEGQYPDEITPLVEDLNALLEDYGAVLRRAREQAGNLAHSLKTPLAVMTNEAAALRARGDAATAAVLEREIARMDRQVQYHLARARAAGAAHVPGIRTPLAPAVEGLARVMRHIHHERGLTLEIEVPDAAWFRGERQDLEEMAGNLLDNACKWARAHVRVSAEGGDESLALLVDDDGPGLPPDRREEVFERGRRLDETREGSGLGLAVVRDLAELYGGKVTLAESPLGGLRVRLRLPGGMDGKKK